MKRWGMVFLTIVSGIAVSFAADGEGFTFPVVKKYGGVATIPQAAEAPKKGVQAVFDITATAEPESVNKGLESVARYLNLNAQAGNLTSDVKLALVVHGGATKVALGDAAYAKQTGAAKNPNLELIRELKSHGVEVFVCGQSLARNKYAVAEVADEFTIAASAMTVNINKQMAGYAYLSIH